jgi:cellulose biosynthesis protein BcsQ
MVADFCIIPVLPSIMDTWATEKFVEHYFTACEQKGELIPASFIINRYKKTTVALELQQALGNAPQITTFNSVIKDRVGYIKAVEDGMGIMETSDKAGRQEVIRFYNELEETTKKIFETQKA